VSESLLLFDLVRESQLHKLEVIKLVELFIYQLNNCSISFSLKFRKLQDFTLAGRLYREFNVWTQNNQLSQNQVS
jgi:hypothetical protein